MDQESTAKRFFTSDNIVRIISKEDIETSLNISMSNSEWQKLKDHYNSSCVKFQLNGNEIIRSLFIIRGEVVA